MFQIRSGGEHKLQLRVVVVWATMGRNVFKSSILLAAAWVTMPPGAAVCMRAHDHGHPPVVLRVRMCMQAWVSVRMFKKYAAIAAAWVPVTPARADADAACRLLELMLLYLHAGA